MEKLRKCDLPLTNFPIRAYKEITKFVHVVQLTTILMLWVEVNV